MGLEVVQIQVLALESVLWVAGDVGGDSVLASNKVGLLVEGSVLGRLEDTLEPQLLPNLLLKSATSYVNGRKYFNYLLEHHDLLVSDTAVVELGCQISIDGHLLGERRANKGCDGAKGLDGRLHLC